MNHGLFARCHHRAGHYALLLLVGMALFLVNLGGATLWDLDEGRNATAALEMLESGKYIVPTFNGNLRTDKPALLYWLQVAAYHMCGVNEYAARLPSALAALVTVLLGYELARRLFNPVCGLLAGLIVASTPMFCAAARFANPDALLNLFTTLTLLVFWLGYDRGRWRFVAMGCAAGFGVLAKGPVGLALPGAVMIVFLAWNRQLRLLWQPRGWLLGMGAFALVALPWYIWVAAETKANFLRGFLLTHNVDRFLSPMENHRGSVLYYPLVLLLGAAPWSVFLGLAAWYACWSAVRRPWSFADRWWNTARDRESADGEPASDHASAYRFLICWITVYVVFFSLAATKLPNYILPVYVPTAVLLGRFLERWWRGAVQPPAWVLHVCLVLLVLVGASVGLGLAVAGGAWELTVLRGRHIWGLERWAALGLVPMAGAAIAWWCWRRQRRSGFVTGVTAAAIGLVGPLAAWGSAALNAYKPAQPLVEQAGAFDRRQDIRIGCWKLEHLPSLNFYCQRDVVHHQEESQVLAFLRYPIPVYLFLPATRWQDLEPRVQGPHRVLSRHRDLYRGGEVVVVTNRND
jgi:4-amino-4-deoxy-L-arabinose transferase-like glycosyltransferase